MDPLPSVEDDICSVTINGKSPAFLPRTCCLSRKAYEPSVAAAELVRADMTEAKRIALVERKSLISLREAEEADCHGHDRRGDHVPCQDADQDL